MSYYTSPELIHTLPDGAKANFLLVRSDDKGSSTIPGARPSGLSKRKSPVTILKTHMYSPAQMIWSLH